MQWKTQEGIKIGDTRTVTYFSLFPTQLDDGYTVWMELYYADEIYKDEYNDAFVSGWETVKTYRRSTEKSF